MALRMRAGRGPDCLISGGEPVVTAGRAVAPRPGRAQPAIGAGGAGTSGRRRRRAASPCSPAAPTAKTARPTPPARCSMPTVLSRPPAARPRPGRLPGPQRRLSLLRAAGRADQDRPDAHQRLRPARGGGRSGWELRGGQTFLSGPERQARMPVLLRTIAQALTVLAVAAGFEAAMLQGADRSPGCGRCRPNPFAVYSFAA